MKRMVCVIAVAVGVLYFVGGCGRSGGGESNGNRCNDAATSLLDGDSVTHNSRPAQNATAGSGNPTVGDNDTGTNGETSNTSASGNGKYTALPKSSIKSDAVWCFPEYYRIDPVSGDVAEWGFKPVTKAFKASNAVFDAEANAVSLVTMKGETVSCQIMVQGALTGVTVLGDGLPGKVKFIYEGYLHFYDSRAKVVRYAPEVALPLEWIGGTFDVGDVPAPLPDIDGKKMQAIWVDITVPHDTPTGKWYGMLTVSAGGKTISEIPVTLTVADVTLPEKLTYLNAIIQYGVFAKKMPDVERDAYTVAHDNRISIHDIPYSSQRGWGFEGVVPKTTLSPVFERIGELRDAAKKEWAAGKYVLQDDLKFLTDPKAHTVSGDDFKYRLNDTLPMHDAVLRECRKVYAVNGAGITDWTEFDKRYGPILDGSAFSDGVPIASFELPFNFNWPAPLDRFDKDDPVQSKMYQDIWTQVAQDFLKHANEKGWTRTQFFVYINPKNRKNNLSMWKGDEPCEKRDFLAHKFYIELFNKAFKNPGHVKVDYKLEIGHWECDYGKCRKAKYDNKQWDEANARELLKEIKVWVPNSRHFHAANDLAKKQIAEQGDRFYTYGGIAGPDQSSMGIYAIAFQALQDSSQGFFYYTPTIGEVSRWAKVPGDKIKGTDMAKANSRIMHYRASEFGHPDKFLPSLRIKELRGVEAHYAAFKAAEAVNPEFAEKLMAKTVHYIVQVSGRETGTKTCITDNNPEDLYEAKLAALAIASGNPSLDPGRGLKGSLPGVRIKSDTFHYCVVCGEACSPDKCEWCGAIQPKE